MDNVVIGNWTGPLDVAANLMDDDIREALHGSTDDPQEFVDLYCAAHLAKFGEEFGVN